MEHSAVGASQELQWSASAVSRRGAVAAPKHLPHPTTILCFNGLTSFVPRWLLDRLYVLFDGKWWLILGCRAVPPPPLLASSASLLPKVLSSEALASQQGSHLPSVLNGSTAAEHRPQACLCSSELGWFCCNAGLSLDSGNRISGRHPIPGIGHGGALSASLPTTHGLWQVGQLLMQFDVCLETLLWPWQIPDEGPPYG